MTDKQGTREWGPRILPKHQDHITGAAKHLLGITSPTWRWKSSECVDKRGKRDAGFIVIGSETAVFMRGPKKGRTKWIGEDSRCVVLREHLEEQYARFEKETGECYACYGIGKRPVGARAKEVMYESCARCASTGKAPAPVAQGK